MFMMLPLRIALGLALALSLVVVVQTTTNTTTTVQGPDDEIVANNSTSSSVTSDRPLKHYHHVRRRKSDLENATSDEAVFLVPDTNAPLNHHKHAPFCLAATMRAKIVIPIAGGDGYVRNKTIVIPKSANVSGTCGDQMQRITLEWGNTRESGRLVKSGQLTMLFEKFSDQHIYLTNVWSTVALYLEDGDQTLTNGDPNSSHNVQYIDMRINNAKLWKTPVRFAYVCFVRLELKLRAETNPIQSHSSQDLLILDPVLHEESFLVFHSLKVEAFRKNRFTAQITHLRYDCKYSWPYDYMPAAVGSALFVLVLFNVIAFRFRGRMGCLPKEDEYTPLDGGK